ncbi:MAG: BTH_I0359 family protein [Rhodoferax sp.]
MNTLYDSDDFHLTHVLGVWEEGAAAPAPEEGQPPLRLARHGFELVDKRTGKEVFLDGAWADLFERHLHDWKQNTPTQEEVEETLERYAALAQTPLGMH